MKFLNALTLIFITLKLTDNIDWSWWFVLSPTITGFVLFIVCLTLRETNKTKGWW